MFRTSSNCSLKLLTNLWWIEIAVTTPYTEFRPKSQYKSSVIILIGIFDETDYLNKHIELQMSQTSFTLFSKNAGPIYSFHFLEGKMDFNQNFTT